MLRYIAWAIIPFLTACGGEVESVIENSTARREPVKCTYTVFNLNGHWGYDAYVGDSMATHVLYFLADNDTVYLTSFNQADSCGASFCNGLDLPNI